MNTFLVLLIAALALDFINGVHDSSNIVATVISSHAIRPRTALTIAAIANFCGPFIFGVAVANTVGADLLDASVLNEMAIISALIAAILWNLFTWHLGIPSSSSHAMLGGLLGSAVLAAGLEVVKMHGFIVIILSLLISPIVGMLAGYFVMKFTLWAASSASPKINNFFRGAQLFTLIGLGLSHGSNDAQKSMGVITLGMVTCGLLDSFIVPYWVIAACAGMIGLGTMFGGWRLIRTLGGKIYRIRPIHAFCSQAAGAGIILGSALLGGPVSTTQVMSSSIIGVGAADRVNKVRWHILKEMAYAWLFTIPTTALLAALIYLALQHF